MFHALGRFSYRYRWAVIGVWLALFAASLFAIPSLSSVLQGGGFSSSDSPSSRAATLIEERLGQGQSNLVAVFSSATLEATSPEFQAEEARLLSQLTAAGIPHLTSVQTYATTGSDQFLSQDGKASLAVLTFDAQGAAVQEQVSAVREALSGTNGELTVHVTGQPAVDADLSDISVKDLQTVELYALPVALLALLLVFGTVVSAVLPVLAGGMAVTITLGAIYLLARVTDMSIFVMNTASLLGLAVAIDYALFMVARFREELSAGASVEEAVVTCTARAGRSVFFSGLAVAVGVLGLLFFPFPGLRSIAIGGAVVVLFSVAASLTLMPALLGVLGPRVNALRVVPQRPPHESRFWKGWSDFVSRRPWLVLAASVILVALVASPVARLSLEMPSATALPTSAESRQGYDLLDSQFDRAALSPISVLATWEGGTVGLSATQALPLFQLGQQLTSTPGVQSVVSLFTLPGLDALTFATMWQQIQQLLGNVDLSTLDADSLQQILASIPESGIALPNGATITREQVGQLLSLYQSSVGERAVLFRVVADSSPTSPEARQLAIDLAAMAPPGGLEVHVAGEAASESDFFRGLTSRFPWVIAYVLVATYLILLFMLRSLLLPLKAVLVNALTILMSFGVLIFIFQDGRLQSLLNYTTTGGTDAVILVVIFCALFGISMDYGVFSLTRMHEAWLESSDNRASVRKGLLQSGQVIVSAALLVVVVTAAFAFTRIALTKELGIGIAVAIALDAILIRMALVPALMTYLGRANWWLPRWLDRLLPDTGHEGGGGKNGRRRAEPAAAPEMDSGGGSAE